MEKRPRYRALVVDDEASMRRLIVLALSREGIECAEAPDGVVATNMVRCRRYDLVTVDLAMPRMNGHKFIQDLITEKHPPAIVVITGVIDGRIARDVLSRGVEDFYFKPLDAALFALKARRILDHRAAMEVAGEEGGRVDLPDQISRTTTFLESQLETIQQSFRETIGELERQRENLELGLVDSVRVLTNIINQVGRFEGSHSVRVEKLAVGIASQLKLGPSLLKDIKMAALLHDIGQFGMPDRVRSGAPWSLSPEDRQIYESYPTIGALLLSEIGGIEGVVPLVEHHTERFDGTGFPDGLAGDKIPLGARILAVADGYETLRQFEDPTNALAAVARQKGHAYDPEIVNLAIAQIRTSELDSASGANTALVPVLELREGSVLADAIFDDRGAMLVSPGRELTRPIIEKVKLLVPKQTVSVYVRSEEQDADADEDAPTPS